MEKVNQNDLEENKGKWTYVLQEYYMQNSLHLQEPSTLTNKDFVDH